MNKPATKEPSMDEILSSIRQIIADDDAGVSQAAPPQQPAPQRPVVPPPAANVPSDPIPLALSAEQIVSVEPPAAYAPTPPYAAPAEPEVPPAASEPPQAVMPQAAPGPQPEPPLSYQSILAATGATTAGPFAEAELVEGDDIEFEAEPAPAPEPVAAAPVWDVPRVPEPPRPPSRPVAETAPMPDPTLSAEIAERLIEPATKAAVRQNFSRLNSAMQMGNGATVEGMMRELLRPMLKEWLDENLPAVVERMVEKEIARISRGVE